MSKLIIYGLVDPRTKLIRYIGLSTRGLVRPRYHGCPCRIKTSNRRALWLKELADKGLSFGIRVLQRCKTFKGLLKAERRWIKFGRAQGWPLTNLADGGIGSIGYKHTTEARRKIARASACRGQTPATKEKLRRIRIGTSMSEASKIKNRLAHLGKKASKKTLVRMRLAHLGKPRPLWVRRKIRATLKGHSVSKLTRSRISAANKVSSLRGEENPKAKLRSITITAVREAAAQGVSQVTLAKKHKVTRSTINKIIHYQTWCHV